MGFENLMAKAEEIRQRAIARMLQELDQACSRRSPNTPSLPDSAVNRPFGQVRHAGASERPLAALTPPQTTISIIVISSYTGEGKLAPADHCRAPIDPNPAKALRRNGEPYGAHQGSRSA
jgi:hypothetical protein